MELEINATVNIKDTDGEIKTGKIVKVGEKNVTVEWTVTTTGIDGKGREWTHTGPFRAAFSRKTLRMASAPRDFANAPTIVE